MTEHASAEERAQRLFETTYGGSPEVVTSAPGRVNLIGEHTDYNGGFVLPMAIPQRTWVAVARGTGKSVRVASDSVGTRRPKAQFELGEERSRHAWFDYVQGCTQALAQAGHALAGADLAISSDVPLGSGLSSSAALEVAIMRALRELLGLALDDVALAKLGQKAENEFVGAPVGIMDQMAASLAGGSTALFLDTRTLEYEQVRLPREGALVVINSGVAHNHALGDYKTRRAECERAAAALGVAQLRDLTTADLDRLASLPHPINRRARHVITENQRVLDAVRAMKTADLERLGSLFYSSHASQRDDFEVSVPQTDLLVELTHSDPAVFGARLTGGGFGGSIVALVHQGEAAAVADRIVTGYKRRSTHVPTVLVPQSF